MNRMEAAIDFHVWGVNPDMIYEDLIFEPASTIRMVLKFRLELLDRSGQYRFF